MLFENNDYDFDILSLSGFDFKNPNSYNYQDNDLKLVNSKEGFARGNMFKNEFIPYKDYSYRELRPTCEREALLFKIMELDFAINDLNLYLDLHPEDLEIYKKYKKYTEECMILKDEYSKTYGPLMQENVESNSYEWLKNPWPWDKSGGSMYV